MADATKKMIEYAEIIALELCIKIPDSNEFRTISKFINDNQKQYRASFINTTNKIKTEYIKHQMGEISESFINEINGLHKKTGIYFFWNNDILVYIGKSIDAKTRILTSLEERCCKTKITHYSFAQVECNNLHIEEMVCISHYKPQLNVDGKTEIPSDMYTPTIDINSLEKIRICD